MMRSPRYVAMAVRRPDRKIWMKSFRHFSLKERYPKTCQTLSALGLRGAIQIFDSLLVGMECLSWSAELAAGEKSNEMNASHSVALVISIVIAFLMGFFLFVGLPHGLALLSVKISHPFFHFIDGLWKIAIFLSYIYMISLIKDVHTVFQYHGAEHQAVSTFEKGLDLTVSNARVQSRFHPRCGTTFLLYWVVWSVLVFSLVFGWLGLEEVFTSGVIHNLVMMGLKILLIFPIVAIAYEVLKVCAFRMNHWFFRLGVLPGLWLQRLTTRLPNDDQRECALAAMKQVLRLEKGLTPLPEGVSAHPHPRGSVGGVEFEITNLDPLGNIQARLEEFYEAG